MVDADRIRAETVAACRTEVLRVLGEFNCSLVPILEVDEVGGSRGKALISANFAIAVNSPE